MADPATYNLSIYQGDNYDLVITVADDSDPPVPTDLTDYTARSHIRVSEDAPATLAEFTITFTNPRTSGEVTLSLTPLQTELLPASGGVWDLEFTTDTGRVQTYLKGSVAVTKEVTK